MTPTAALSQIVALYESAPDDLETMDQGIKIAKEALSPLTDGGRRGVVVINGAAYVAEQKTQDGNFRKRATRYFIGGKWSEWCKDDHDLFTVWGD